MQRRYFFERLHHQHEQIEVKTNHGADDVDPAPRPCEMLCVTRKNRKCEERQRYDAETDGRRETMKREKESRDRRRDGCDQKPFRPIVETFTSKHSKHNDEAGENCDQTDQGVNNGVDLQYHRLPITSVSALNVTSRLLSSRELHTGLLARPFPRCRMNSAVAAPVLEWIINRQRVIPHKTVRAICPTVAMAKESFDVTRGRTATS
jgi:hypothetical protein